MKNQHLYKRCLPPVVLALVLVLVPAVASHFTSANTPGMGGSYQAQMGLPIHAIITAARAQFTDNSNDPVALDPSLTGFDTSRFGPKQAGEGDGNDNIFISVAVLVLIAAFSLGSFKHQRNKRLRETSDPGRREH